MVFNKRIAISFLTIVAVLTAVVGITIAQFSDTATLSNNTLSTGAADLQIGEFDGANCVSYSSVSSGINSDDLAPGQSETLAFCLKNNSESDITLDVTAAITIDSGALDPSLVTVTITCNTGAVSGTLDTPFPGSTVATITAGQEVGCNIEQEFSSSATNSAANKNIQYDVVFTGTQAP